MTVDRPEIGARLDHLCISSPDPTRLAEFFERVYAMVARPLAEGLIDCSAHGRRVLIAPGPANQTRWFAYAFADARRLAAALAEARSRGASVLANPSPVFGAGAFAVRDPDGNTVVFGERAEPGPDVAALPARLQHVVFRTTRLDEMVEHYASRLGFVVSDRVHDGAGVLRACFLRTDIEHHSLALFRSPETRLDHHSYETTDWELIRRWADDFSVKRVPIFWGVGRHGPGNDLFFMVKDPDDNLVEISAEIEQCAIERPTGIWPHEERTLNVWGNAILRS
jgi:catechol 2,3-dioxygenase-like lactoylglutathione lyase family enzyme